MSVGVDDLTPAHSESSVVYGVLGFEDVSHSLAEIPLGTSFVVAVSNGDQSLAVVLGGLSSSESGEHSLLVESHGLGLMMYLVLGCHFLGHCSLFVINNTHLSQNTIKVYVK